MTVIPIIETLADIEHQRWASWQQYLHTHPLACRHPDGSITLFPEIVTQWERQIATPYAELSEREKESDREQVLRYWPLLVEKIKDYAEAALNYGFTRDPVEERYYEQMLEDIEREFGFEFVVEGRSG